MMSMSTVKCAVGRDMMHGVRGWWRDDEHVEQSDWLGDEAVKDALHILIV